MAFTYPWQAGALMLVLVGGGMVACERRAPQQELTGSGVTQPVESRPPEAQTDTGITTAVQAEYYRDDLVRGRRIDVTTENGVVTLEGTVRSDEVKQRAVDLAQGVGGVTRVDDQLIVQQQSAAAGDTRGPSAGEEDRARPGPRARRLTASKPGGSPPRSTRCISSVTT